MSRFLILFGLLAVAGLWLTSQLDPTAIGTCHVVVLRLGSIPTTTDCQPISTTAFAVPVGLVILGALLLGDTDWKITTALGTFESTRRGRRAAQTLRQFPAGLNVKADTYGEAVEPSGAPTQEGPPNA